MKFRILMVALCVFLGGCRFDLPAVDSGKLAHHVAVDGRDRVTNSALSQAQLKALKEWFSTHQTGWEKSYADVGPGRFVYFYRGGVSVAYLNLIGNTLYAASYSRKLSPDEQQTLEKILDEKKG
jgi:hypothetical protein